MGQKRIYMKVLTLTYIKIHDRKKVSTLEFELDELQQYTRRPNLRIQGIEEDFRGEDLESKVLAVINSHMKVDPLVERKDIERCHRLGRRLATL